MVKKFNTNPTPQTTILSNGMSLESFINDYGTFGPDSFYQGKQFMKLLQEAEFAARNLGCYVLQDFYDVVSGKQALHRAKDSRQLINQLFDNNTKYREKIWELTPLEERFKHMLSRHDWYYHHSDDNGVWKAGEASWKAIQDVLKKNPEFQSILDEYKKERNC